MASEPAPACDLLIVWHSVTGSSRQLAEAAWQGAGDTAARCLRCTDAGPQDVLAAKVLLFVCPENLGSMSGLMKDFFDRCYYPVLDRVAGRGYATIISAGSDGQGAARQVDRIVTGWRLRQAAPTLIVCTHAQTPEAILAPKHLSDEALAPARELGEALAGGAAMGVF